MPFSCFNDIGTDSNHFTPHGLQQRRQAVGKSLLIRSAFYKVFRFRIKSCHYQIFFHLSSRSCRTRCFNVRSMTRWITSLKVFACRRKLMNQKHGSCSVIWCKQMQCHCVLRMCCHHVTGTGMLISLKRSLIEDLFSGLAEASNSQLMV